MTWHQINLAAPEFAKPSEPPSIAGLVYREKRHLISGPPETAKTLLALIFALEETRRKGAVAIIDFENGPFETRRLLEDLGATEDEVREVMYFEPDGPPDANDIQMIVGNGVSLAIIDALAGAYDASGLDDEKRREVERFARTWIKPLWQQGVATIAIDHVVKNHENRGKFSIGSERKLGTVDVHLGLKAVRQLHRGSSGLITISTHKDRPAHLNRPVAAEVELHSDPITHRITWQFKQPNSETDTGEWRPTVLMEKVSRYLERHPDGANRTAIYAAVEGKRDYLIVSVDSLLADGHAVETVPGKKGTAIRSIKPFRAEPSPSSPIVPDRPRDDASPSSPPSHPPTGGTGDGTNTNGDLDPDYIAYLESLEAEMTEAGELA